MSSIALATLADLTQPYRLYGVCNACQRMELVNLFKATQSFGGAFPIARIKHKLRCGGCHSKDCGIRIVWAGNCWRRVKSEPPRRLNNEPGVEAGVAMPAVDKCSGLSALLSSFGDRCWLQVSSFDSVLTLPLRACSRALIRFFASAVLREKRIDSLPVSTIWQ